MSCRQPQACVNLGLGTLADSPFVVSCVAPCVHRVPTRLRVRSRRTVNHAHRQGLTRSMDARDEILDDV